MLGRPAEDVLTNNGAAANMVNLPTTNQQKETRQS
jgi:hypothetical protein